MHILSGCDSGPYHVSYFNPLTLPDTNLIYTFLSLIQLSLFSQPHSAKRF